MYMFVVVQTFDETDHPICCIMVCFMLFCVHDMLSTRSESSVTLFWSRLC